MNCDLLEFIRNVGTELKLNYIIDPKVKGIVTIHTYGELKREDLLPVLETVLRINGAAMVQNRELLPNCPRCRRTPASARNSKAR